MPKSAIIRARVDPQLKEEVEAILQDLGLSTTQALTLYFQQIRMKKGLPFAVTLRNESPGMPREEVGDEATSFPVNPDRAVMRQNAQAYHAMHVDLVKAYDGKYVAICDGELVDYDTYPVALLQRVRTTHPGQVVLRRKVERVAEPELRLRHPRVEPL